MTARLRALGLLLLAAALPAQDRVALRVVSVAGSSVYVDRGRDDGLRAGGEVELLPPGAPPLRLVVADVTARGARLELPPGSPAPAIGTPGEFERERAHRDGDAAPVRARPAPAHPPWSMQPGALDPDAPLLAPAHPRAPAARPAQWHGRAFLQGRFDHDGGDGRDADWALGRLGVRSDLDNALGLDGRIALAGELTYREHGLGETDRSGRLDRLSYTLGRDEDARVRAELGRFVPREVPELGLVDGADLALRLGSGWHLGGGAGALPLPFADLDDGGDIGVHAFLGWRARDHGAGFTIAFQHTWHDGTPDRDLLVLRGDWRATDSLRFAGAAVVDFYTASDRLEPDDTELTRGYASADWRATGALDLGVHASRFGWPELKRTEWVLADPALIRDGFVERVSPRARLRIGEHFALEGHYDTWRDQDRDGDGFRAAADLYRLTGGSLDLGVAVSAHDGGSQSTFAIRASARRRGEHVDLGAWAEQLRWETSGLVSGEETFTERRLGATLDARVGADLDLSFEIDYRTGGGQDGYGAGVFVQHRW